MTCLDDELQRKGHMLKTILAISAFALASAPAFAQHSEQAQRELEVVAKAKAEADAARKMYGVKVRGMGEAEMEKATFLGVVTSRAGETLSEQLGLPRGVGLTVESVIKDTPAEKAEIKEH